MNDKSNKECDKKSWKAPELILMSVSENTKYGYGTGHDAGNSSSAS